MFGEIARHSQILDKIIVQGAKKIIFTACHLGKLKLAFTSPDVISTSPKSFLTSRIDFTVLLLFKFLKKHHSSPSNKLITEFTSPIKKYTSPGLFDTTFFASCLVKCVDFHLYQYKCLYARICSYKLTEEIVKSSFFLFLSSILL